MTSHGGNDPTPETQPSPARHMSAQDFAAWGYEDTAYVKPVRVDAEGNEDDQGERMVYSIHAVNGQRLGIAENRDLAFAAVTREGLEPVSVH